MTYRLTEKAADDLQRIYAEGARLFGTAHATAYHVGLRQSFEALARFPDLAEERAELTPPVRIHPCGSHIIIYVVDAAGFLIVRVRHGQEDWADA